MPTLPPPPRLPPKVGGASGKVISITTYDMDGKPRTHILDFATYSKQPAKPPRERDPLHWELPWFNRKKNGKFKNL